MFRNQQSGSLSGLFFGLLFAVIGFFVAFFFGKPILDNAKASQTWPKTSGKITHSSVSTSRSRSNGKTKTLYSSDVTYQYQVQSRDYTCSNVFFGGDASSSSSSAAHQLVERYPTGRQVDVFYDPKHPENAVLEPGAHWQSYLVYGIGLLFLVVGLLVAGSSLLYLLAAASLLGVGVAAWLGVKNS